MTSRSLSQVHWIASGFGTIDGGFSDRNIARKHPQKNFASAKKHSIRVRNEVRPLERTPAHDWSPCMAGRASQGRICDDDRADGGMPRTPAPVMHVKLCVKSALLLYRPD